MRITVSAAFLLSLLLSCMAAPAPIVPLDPISLGAITASFGLAEGLTFGLGASTFTFPTWLLALKAGLLGKSVLLGAGSAGAGVGAAATRAAIARNNNFNIARNNNYPKYPYN